MKSQRISSLAVFTAILFVAGTVQAGILEDFPFDDPNGTLLGAAANSANPPNLWSEDAVDMTSASVQSGVYHIGKTNDGFGTNFLQIANITSGKAWIVAEISGWHFSSIAGPSEFDSAELEDIRFDFLDNDTGTSGSTITAEVAIQRKLDGGLEILGRALGSGTGIAAQDLPLTQIDPFVVVLALDKSANAYEIFTKDGPGPFTSLGTGDVDPTRNGNSIRFVANNNFGGTQEFFNIDRIYLTDMNPVPEPGGLTLACFAAAALLAWRRSG
jgi:hypothetical protein